MSKMINTDAMGMAETLAKDGFPSARDYFTSPASTEANPEHARDVLKALSVYSRIRATRANEAAISVAIAKMANLNGEALLPMFEQLTGLDAKAQLPMSESSGDKSKGKK